MKKTKVNTSFFLAFIIFVLIGLAIGIGLMNILYWESVIPNSLYTSGIDSNLAACFIMLFICAACWLFLDSSESNGKENRYYWILPVIMIITKILMEMGFGLTANGKTWWLGITFDGLNYITISYFTLMLIPLIAIVPRGINNFVKNKYSNEKLIISIYAAIISLMSTLMYREMKGATICGLFILVYYFLKSDKKNRWLVFLPYIVVMLFGAFYGVNGKFSTFYIQETFNRLISRDANIYSFNANQLWYLKEYSSWAGVIALLVIYVLIIILLLVYILKYIVDREKRMNAMYLWATMLIMWIFVIVGNLFNDFNLSFNVPFLAKNSFIWLLFVVMIISLNGNNWKEELEEMIDAYLSSLGYELIEDERVIGSVAYGHKLDDKEGIIIIVKYEEDEHLTSRLIFSRCFDEDKELDVYRIINKYNNYSAYNCHISDNNVITFAKIDNVKIPNHFDILDWYDEFDFAMLKCEKMYKEIYKDIIVVDKDIKEL